MDYKRDYTSKNVDKSKGFDDVPSIEMKTSMEKGDLYLASTSTHLDHDVSLINLDASFHMNPYMFWFCEYEKYNRSDVLLRR
jgi:hypothetical protein